MTNGEFSRSIRRSPGHRVGTRDDDLRVEVEPGAGCIRRDLPLAARSFSVCSSSVEAVLPARSYGTARC